MMFHRRHVFEHRAGVADSKYLVNSGDTTVKEGQAIREKKANADRLIEGLLKMARNVDEDFHNIFPPDPTAVRVCGPRSF